MSIKDLKANAPHHGATRRGNGPRYVEDYAPFSRGNSSKEAKAISTPRGKVLRDAKKK